MLKYLKKMVGFNIGKVVFSLGIFLLSPGLFAAEDYCAAWGCVGTIEQLYTNKSGDI